MTTKDAAGSEPGDRPDASPDPAAWLDAAVPRPPNALARRVRDAIGSAGDRRDVATALLEAGIDLAATLGAGGSKDRAAALDLLAADALVTYAFEAAADDPSRVPRLADDAMRRISSLAPDR